MDQSEDVPGELGDGASASRPEPDGARPGTLWTDRRGFIGSAAGVIGAVAIEAVARQGALYRNANALLAGPLLRASAPAKPSFSIDIRRRADFLLLRADGYNLVQKGQRLGPRNPRLPAHLVVTFVPQHLAEEAFAEGASTPKPGLIHAQLAGPSRLAFVVPETGIALTVDGLLSWDYLTPSLVAAASRSAQIRAAVLSPNRLASRHRRPHRGRAAATYQRGPRTVTDGALSEPTVTETALELPWHLALSPTADGRWVNETEPVTLNGATEMWRTQLTTGEGSAGTPGGALRAVWNYDTVSTGQPTLDFNPFPGATPSFRSSLRADDRWDIVRASADFSLPGRADISARQLLLSARGGSLSAEGSWNITALPIAEWTHEATGGRDQYVKVVNKGFLLPFGHAVSLVLVTQREFDDVGTRTVGYLRQTTHIVASSSVVSHDPASNPAVSYNGRDFPFRSVELTDAATPTLDPIAKFLPTDPNDPEDFTNPPAFVPTVGGGQPVSWHFVGTDWSGRTTSFSAQAVFVSYTEAMDGDVSAQVGARYNELPSTDPLRTTDFGGSTLTFAESFMAGDTDLSAHVMTFAASTTAVLSLDQHESLGLPYFLPTLASAVSGVPTGAQVTVTMPAVAQAAGAPLSGNSLPALAFYPDFVENGFYSAASTANKGNVFMEALGDATQLPNLTFDPKSAGGVMTPNLQIQGLSRSLGPVGDLATIYGGQFNPGAIFASLDGPNAASLLGGVKLSDILDVADLLDSTPPNADAPSAQGLKVTSTRQGQVVTTIVSYAPKLKQTLGPNVPEIITLRDDPTSNPLMFTLSATITTDALNPLNSMYEIHGELDNFIVNLVSASSDDQFISIVFDRFSFDSVSGGKPKLGVKVDTVNFDGALKFVTQLAAFMSLDGAGGPSILDLVDSIASDLSLKLPSIDVGILSLSHIAIDTGFKLPFDGSGTEFNFGFATPDNPFQLALGIFGGGGFLNLSLGTFGVKEIAGSFEFGAMAALDIGVASGAVSLTAGFYFKYAVDTTQVDLTKTPPPIPPTTCVLSGFVKITGYLSVLEIVTLSLEFDLTLTYLDPPGSLTGTAMLVVSVALGFFHKSVTLTATKTFVNGASTSNARPSLVPGAHDVIPNTPQSFGDQMQQDDWDTYCQAFAPVS